MEYKYYYLIRYNNKKYLVLAENSQQAISLWIANQQQERDDEGRVVKFKPKSFSVEEIEREDFVIKE